MVRARADFSAARDSGRPSVLNSATHAETWSADAHPIAAPRSVWGEVGFPVLYA
ncbi:hypothetical protein AB0L50_36580 [Streptomyces flaveolus]|uniref:hypothetical protein n=1 Tax=Streptomyces flaveolus TaxID=67297 RepID=UPI0034218AB3